MAKLQKTIPKKMENKPKLNNPIKQRKQSEKKKSVTAKKASLINNDTPVKETKVLPNPGKKGDPKKQNKKQLNGEQKVEIKPFILAPESPQKKQNAKGKKNKVGKGNNVAKNGLEKNANSTEIPAKVYKIFASAQKPENLKKQVKGPALGPTSAQKKSDAPVTVSTTKPKPEKKQKQKQKNKKAETEQTPAIEKIKKVQKPKIVLQEKKKAKIAFKKMELASKGQPPKNKKAIVGTTIQYAPIPYDEDRFNAIVNTENIKKIAESLKAIVENEVKTKKSLVFDDYRYVLDVLAFKIPSCPKRMVRLNLKHSLVDNYKDVLLVVPDLQRGVKADYEPTIDYCKDLLRKNGIEGLTVMPMNQLRKEYKTFELKRRLCASYEYFLCDGRISGLVVAIVGKFTQKTRNCFQSVRLYKNKDMKTEIEKSMKRTSFRMIGKSSLFSIPVGSHKFSADQLADNIEMVVAQLKTVFPGGLGNIRNLHLKIDLTGTSSLPLYMSMGQVPEETPVVIGPREQRMLKLKREANEVLTNFSMTKEGKMIKLTKSAVEKKKKLMEMKAGLKKDEDEKSAKQAKKAKKDSKEGGKKNTVKELKELEVPENEEEDDDSEDDEDEQDVIQLGQGSDDEAEDDQMENQDEEDTESGAEIVENGIVGEDDEDSEEDDEQEVNSSENDEDEDEDDDEDEDEDEEEESD